MRLECVCEPELKGCQEQLHNHARTAHALHRSACMIPDIHKDVLEFSRKTDVIYHVVSWVMDEALFSAFPASVVAVSQR